MPSVVVPSLTVSLSNCVVVVVSAVSMCRKNDNVALHPDGMVTDWDSVSVCVVPYPSSQASNVPACAGSDGAVRADHGRRCRPRDVAGLEAGVAQLLAR